MSRTDGEVALMVLDGQQDCCGLSLMGKYGRHENIRISVSYVLLNPAVFNFEKSEVVWQF